LIPALLADVGKADIGGGCTLRLFPGG